MIMSAYEEFKELISKLDDPESKSKMTTLLSDINKEKGIALTDLKTQKELVNSQKGDIKTLTDIAKAFKDSGVEVKDNAQMVELAKQFNVNVDNEGSLAELNKLVTERDSTIQDMQDKLKAIDVERTMNPLFEEARKEFKDEDGKEIKVLDIFLDKTSLYKVDTSQDVLVNKAINDILIEGQAKTEAFMKSEGLDRSGVDTHSNLSQDSGITNRSTGIEQTNAQKHWDNPESAKTVNDLAAVFAQRRTASENDAQ